MGRWCACAAKACWGLKVQRQNITPASTLSNLARALASSFKRPGPVRALAPVTLVLPRVVVDAVDVDLLGRPRHHRLSSTSLRS